MGSYSFLSEIIVRTPANSFCTEIDRELVEKTLEDPAFLEALYLASPNLYQSALILEKLKEKHQKKVIFALAKYILRGRTRSTPFGLFSETGILKWGTDTDVEKNKLSARKTRIAYASLQELATIIFSASEYQLKVKYFPNATIYELPEEIRYVEERSEEGKSNFQICSVEKNDFILKALFKARKGILLNSLVDFLTQEDIDLEEARSFILSLIDSQLLVSVLKLPITGTDPLDYLIKKTTIHSDYYPKLLNAKKALNVLDNQAQNKIKAYEDLEAKLTSEENISFYVNKFSNYNKGTVSKNVQKDILEAVAFINQMTLSTSKDSLDKFKAKFERRFGNDEVPLLLAMDTEIGIGYEGDFDAGNSPLIDGISFSNQKEENSDESWTENEKILAETIKEAKKTFNPIKLEELKLHQGLDKLNLSSSTSVLFRMMTKDTIYLEGITSSSAVNINNRLASDFEPIEKLIKQTLREEVKNNPDVIFAEIVHLPEPNLGDILARKITHKYQIPILSNSLEKISIPLEDLIIRLYENRIILKSISKNKIVIPRLSNSHNFKIATLPVYLFLSDLQFQDVSKKIRFDWGSLKKDCTFLPRVYYKKIIVSLATWQLNAAHISGLKSLAAFSAIKKELKFPRYVDLIEGDNELFIDTENPFLIELFLDHIEGQREVTLKEFILEKDAPIRDYKGDVLSNQLVASLIRTNPIFKSISERKKITKSRKNTIVPLKENWQYLKLYCGNTAVDTILLNFLEPFIETCTSQELIDEWFFIRYKDPDFHIRIRFLLGTTQHLIGFWAKLNDIIKILHSKQLIWKTEVGHYQPESQRYKALDTGLAEHIFRVDSVSYIDLLKQKSLYTDENFRWLFALRAVDWWLDSFGLNLNDKKDFAEKLRNTFALEFNVGQTEKKDMDIKYRATRTGIENFLNGYSSNAEYVLEKKKIDLGNLNLLGPWNVDEKSEALASVVHMAINRLMTNNARLHELFVYDFLFRQYRSRLSRKA
ncbi:MAG: thiopeptide-type bacteriocin biosynthesis protein [Arcticibacterium sp.]|jgi:thiopeptide-type bacteriocin biosynthesis protein